MRYEDPSESTGHGGGRERRSADRDSVCDEGSDPAGVLLFRAPFLFDSQSALRRLDSLHFGLIILFCGGSGQAVVPVVPESESGRGIPSRTLFRSGGQYGLSPPARFRPVLFILRPDSPATGLKFVILYDDTQTMGGRRIALLVVFVLSVFQSRRSGCIMGTGFRALIYACDRDGMILLCPIFGHRAAGGAVSEREGRFGRS